MTIPIEVPPAAPASVESHDIGRLLVQSEDRPGLVAAVASFLAEAGANIIELGQYSTDPEGGSFFQRTVFHLAGLRAAQPGLESGFAAVADRFALDWSITRADQPKRVAIMVSRYDHCLLDLLWRAGRAELGMTPVVVISNHTELADAVRGFGVPFFHVPVTRATKADA